MALTYLKNKVTGELREIEAGCKEYLELAAQRIRDHEGDGSDADGAAFPEAAHRPLWEDRGVAGHAEANVEPTVGNVNDRKYDDSLVGAAPELGIDPDLTPAGNDEREQHAKVANSGTTALDDKGDGTVKSEDSGKPGDAGKSDKSETEPAPAASV